MIKRIASFAAVVCGSFFLFGAQSAFAVNELCTSTSGSPGTGLCTVSTTHTVAGGAFFVDRNMLITGTGKIITTGGNALSIEITAGNLTMQSGALIDGSFATGTGASILITLDAGDVDLQTGSIIRSNGKSGGAIKIVNNVDTTKAHTFDIDGLVESVGSITGTGATQAPGGGTITIVAGCELTVSDTGLVSSRGADPGADLVHLEGCTVVVDGIVESTGPGHTNPNSPANHCNLDPAAHPDGGASFFSACVEIWGNTVTINSIAPHKGEVRTDPPGARNPGRGWIDVFANGDITLNNDTSGAYSVHANSQASGNNSNSFGGLVTVKSYVGKFTASGFAIQANGLGLGSDGGDVIVQAGGAGAAGDVAFGSSSIQAKAGTGANAQGGHISAKSFNGSVTGTFVTTTAGELNAANGVGATVGTVLLEACVGDPAVTYAGTVTGTETDHGPGAPYCGGNPSFSSTANWSTGVSPNTFITVTAAACPTRCGGSCSKSGTKFNDLNGNHVRDGSPLEPGLPGWTITLWNFNQTAVVAVAGNPATTAADGSYSFTGLAPDIYVVCETPQAGWTQTAPVPGAGIVNCANGTKGYQFTLSFAVNNCTDTGNDFGNRQPTTSQCPEDPNAVLTESVGNPGSGVPNFNTVQDAYNAAANGAVIGLFSNTVENLLLGGAKTLEITQCTNAKVTGVPGVLAPVWDIESTGKLTIIGPDSVGGTFGWWVAGNGGHTLKSVRANGASLAGIAILSNNNTVSWNDVSGNGPGAGIVVVGGSNSLKGGTVGPNTGDGVQLQGNSNSLSGATLNSNTGSGVVVSGSTNTIKSNKANSNGFDGFWNFAGAGNTYSGNSSNTGSTPNGNHQYEFATAGVNGGSNRADGVNVPSASKCTNFATAGSFCD